VILSCMIEKAKSSSTLMKKANKTIETTYKV
jgi:hypothetical protein